MFKYKPVKGGGFFGSGPGKPGRNPLLHFILVGQIVESFFFGGGIGCNKNRLIYLE